MRRSKIIGVGHHVPERVITNNDLEQWMDTSDEWITERTGIKERRWITEGKETLSGLATEASLKAIKMAGIEVTDIDFIIFASMASDSLFPGGGCYVNEKLGLAGVPALDIRNQCTGFVYAVAVADQFIKTGMYNTVLVIGAEVQSTGLDVSTEGRDTAVIFGDGAGAAILTATDEDRGVLTSKLFADGKFAKELWQELPSVNKKPYLPDNIRKNRGAYPYMNGQFVFKHAVTKFPKAIQAVLDDAGYSKEDLKMVIPHQANQRITEAVARRFELNADQVYSNIHKYGNTTAASIPIALSEAVAEGKIKDGDLVCLAAFGSGFTWGANLIRW
ncbi:MAG: ketoacyl-ACP synthase III [Calditrichia bacterium]